MFFKEEKEPAKAFISQFQSTELEWTLKKAISNTHVSYGELVDQILFGIIPDHPYYYERRDASPIERSTLIQSLATYSLIEQGKISNQTYFDKMDELDKIQTDCKKLAIQYTELVKQQLKQGTQKQTAYSF